MTEFRAHAMASGAGFQLQALGPDGPLSYRAWLADLRHDPEVAMAFGRTLAALPFGGFAWECRPVTAADLDAPLEMVAVESPALASIDADPAPFAAELARAKGADVAVFENLGRDALLVVPCARAAPACYAHLATFVRSAPASQVAGFWREVASAIEGRLKQRTRPLWVSTAGLGVSWLHVRLDDRPKYYRHAPFRSISPIVR